ncbi:MAG TPA: aldo/keto reductase [Bryobacteraceae bacterium]|nr:aldo/keto reductase [Bryobacteraceae bacterium]
MDNRELIGTALKVSRVCFGTMTFGSQTDREAAARMMDYSIDHGVNFFDTANTYNGGESERILGELLGSRRQNLILASKVGMKTGDETPGLSRAAILAACENSLKRLRTDYLDVYYLHAPDYTAGIDETLDAMHALVQSGKVRYAATSNYASWQVMQIFAISEKKGYAAPRISQPMYNVVARRIETEYLPLCKELGVSTVVYNPLAGGLLTNKHQAAQPIPGSRFDGNDMYQRRYWKDENFQAVAQLASIAAAEGRSIVSLALNWLLHHSPADCIILGASRMEHLEANLNACGEGPLSNEALAGCDEVWKLVGGVAPKYNR